MSKGNSGGGAGFSRDDRGRKIYPVGGQRYVRSPNAAANGEVVVLADVNKLDRAWSQDRGFYIPPGGGGAEIGGRREDFRAFQRGGKPIEMPRVTVGRDGSVSFIDGRHRTSELRDQGVKVIPVTVDRSEAKRAQRAFGVRGGR